MNPLIQLKAAILPLLITFTLAPAADAGPTAPSPSNVNVVNTPNINVVNTPTVQDVDNPARQPFQATAGASFVDGSCETGPIPIATVPAGKRLVIKQAECAGTLLHELGHTLAEAHIQTTVGTITAPHHLLLSTGVTECSGNDIVVGVGEMQSYADPGTVVYGFAARDSASGNNDSVAFAISGYFVDCPACAADRPNTSDR